MQFEAVIGVEVHAELETQSKMFCACPVVDSTRAEPNTAVCPVCAGMPGVLPVMNQRAVEYALRVALALDCDIAETSIFARKNYFYPDLPKGYQISQYEYPLARNGRLPVQTPSGERMIRIRRVHLEEDTGKLTHISQDEASCSLVDLNRAGVPLLEIVTEPDMHTAEEVRLYAMTLRSLLRYLGVNSGDMQKGVMRIEPNVSVRPAGTTTLGTRVEIKNLNSFRSLERAVDYEIRRQSESIIRGIPVRQETVGWDVSREVTFIQRVKEGEDDYRYFPEPDLPPLVVESAWVEQIRRQLPELPAAKYHRFKAQYELSDYDTGVLVAEQSIADYFEQVVRVAPGVTAKQVANWVTGELFSLMNQAGVGIEAVKITPQALAALVEMTFQGAINNTTAKTVLAEMFATGRPAAEIIAEKNLRQISDAGFIATLVSKVLSENSEQVSAYLNGKETVSRWLFGQVMRQAGGQANPQLVQVELDRQLAGIKSRKGKV
ncbi:MAG: Asp-tRNA(Asn)/Glu-tRNA(Gln) amidotransferase subunit GatB [Chloroflexota bacterium]|nr:MAG: Asp-tRNA(Asn)/Glu-tRNA(Gln) amidotransferase subunit GatB [Chloroflexota bacterium]